MNKHNNLEEEYIKLKTSAAPDLWDRIEANLPDKQRPRLSLVRFYPLAAAASVLVLVGVVFAAGRVFGPTEGSVAGTTVHMAAETIMATETTVATETRSDSRELNAQVPGAVVYEELPLAKAVAVTAVAQTKKPMQNLYFSEDVLKNTQMLCQVTIEQAVCDTDETGQVTGLTYQVSVDQVFYAEDYVTEKTMTVKSQLPAQADQGEAIPFAMLEGRTYLIPLKQSEQNFWLVFPFAPQIEVTQRQEYIFHNGWQSLISQEAQVVFCQAQSDQDYYFDRMLIRRDPSLVTELVSMTEFLHGEGRNYEKNSG